MMAHGLEIAVIMMVVFSLTFFSSESAGSMLPRDSERLHQMKLVLGSRPPLCVNKCSSCRPCIAALVTSPHHKNDFNLSYQRDESYYLLSWKCKCKDKLFQP
ncbi:EPIDERMAL PATTERNING FACTOR-like protein 8 [Morella rubra]|uniref:Epidermal patterning factor-like protein n=1 Tax=Morella rubra TaxID=262757 RepID=A0A6A1UGN3_9ROSI|nr:EPIDERMAL PATTERNING FACTOR-like protein 8 [Morella rubra]